jgi:P pilus assembly protein, porin PapC
MNISIESIQIKEQKDKSVQLCLSPMALQHLSLDTEQLPSEALTQMKQSGDESMPCLVISQLLPRMSGTYDSGAQRLDLSIPQARLKDNGRRYQ